MHIVLYLFLLTEQAETYLQSSLVWHLLTYIYPTLFVCKENIEKNPFLWALNSWLSLNYSPVSCLIIPLYDMYNIYTEGNLGHRSWHFRYCTMCTLCSADCLKRGGAVAESTNQPSSFVFPKSYHYLNFALTLIFAFSFWQTAWNLRLKPVFVVQIVKSRAEWKSPIAGPSENVSEFTESKKCLRIYWK